MRAKQGLRAHRLDSLRDDDVWSRPSLRAPAPRRNVPDAGRRSMSVRDVADGKPALLLAPDKPACVTIDRPCSGTTVTCSCFSVDPCDAHLTNACAASLIQGRDIECHGA